MTENETQVQDIAPVDVTEAIQKRTRKVSDFKTLPGSEKLLGIAQDVIKNLAAILKHNELVEQSVKLGLFPNESAAREKFKTVGSDLQITKLRAYVRASVQRSDVRFNPIVLCRIAEAIAKEISPTDEIIRRQNVKSAEQSEAVAMGEDEEMESN